MNAGSFSCRNWDSPGTPKSCRFTTDPVLGGGIFLSVFEHQIFWLVGGKRWNGSLSANSHSSLYLRGCMKLSAQELSPHSWWTCNGSHHISEDRLKHFWKDRKSTWTCQRVRKQTEWQQGELLRQVPGQGDQRAWIEHSKDDFRGNDTGNSKTSTGIC